ncbi:response regulator [Corallococcus praedator]|uniref:Response regulator n=1 Tax=Corallococcus praedator TaxID=2316724 RepID=A0ABX9QH71_9BACT|nr:MULTISPECIES: response regulator [Corallococcus]RKH17524.1 response regulator [Corallococcus sp. CA047B]RKH32192.1 response regulator [Corallococcus sp. CA031C]RKI06490.1 response regulator [Corallococcus praedator]
MAHSEVSRPVLVVEDDDDVRAAIAEILEGEGYEVAVAANGREALDELVHLRAPCLILLDLRMPVLDGAGFLLNLRSDWPRLRDVPVLVLTAVDSEPPPDTQGLLRKPIIPDELLASVGRLAVRRP